MKGRPLLLRSVLFLLAVCVSLAVFAFRCAAESAEEAPPPPTGSGVRGSEFPYLLGTGVLLGMLIAIRLRRKAAYDPTRR